MHRKRITANGLAFAYLESGDGPLVVLLHGFPDNAHSWEHQIEALARAGYRVVAPFLRGYPPSEVPEGGHYDLATLATDVKCLIEVLNHGQPAYLVGQDWGAAISYGVLGAYPQWIRRAVILAVPHPAEVRRTLRRSPRHVLRSFHWFLFQLPWLPEALCRARDFAFIEFLWKLWSPAYDDHAHMARIKRMLAEPGALEASLAYYRAMMNPRQADPALAQARHAWRTRSPPLRPCCAGPGTCARRCWAGSRTFSRGRTSGGSSKAPVISCTGSARGRSTR